MTQNHITCKYQTEDLEECFFDRKIHGLPKHIFTTLRGYIFLHLNHKMLFSTYILFILQMKLFIIVINLCCHEQLNFHKQRWLQFIYDNYFHFLYVPDNYSKYIICYTMIKYTYLNLFNCIYSKIIVFLTHIRMF